MVRQTVSGVSKTTILLPVTPSTTLSSLRSTVLAALASTASSALDDDPELPQLPTDADDIALWRLDAPERDADGNEADKWIQLRDEKSGVDKLGLHEGDEVGVSFKDADGSFPPPTIVRPVDDDELE
ncbi:hypothetical protein DMC30DRAFT_414211 [Rhodotorula diobovata]|uniref:Uncharacterized protein n=1 Tax=Rhodotorula diobovata TaxID=5288 RepID=A0A5C5G4D5_9BASI|nr:hypothetical protein DMC30DRAFT_414211 [Rhodotorula diobovata]